jgi:hypothetical protein
MGVVTVTLEMVRTRDMGAVGMTRGLEDTDMDMMIPRL